MAIPSVRLSWAVLAGTLAALSATRPVSAQISPIRTAVDSAALTLSTLLASVRTRAPALEAAQARARAARGARTTAGTLENPTLAYQVENTPFPGGRPLVGMDAEHMSTASVPLAPLFQRGARVAQATANVRAAEADVRVTAQRVALDAARAYYRTALAEVGADAADNLTQWLDSVVTYNRTRVQQGVAAEADLIRSELERDRARADAGMQAAELARARAELSVYLGDAYATAEGWRVALVDAPLALPLSAASRRSDSASTAARVDLASLTSSTAQTLVDIGRRPDVIAARERVTAATAGTALEQRMRLRELGAMLGVKQSGGVSSMLAGVSVPLPLFDQNRGALAVARAQRDAAGFDLLAQERTARAELLGAAGAARILTDRATALAQRDSAGRGAAYLVRADDARAIALGAYREGAVPLLQVLDAARAWGEARLAYFRTLYAQHEAVLALIVAQGDDLLSAVPTPIALPARSGGPR